jgi:hypothetical protein
MLKKFLGPAVVLAAMCAAPAHAETVSLSDSAWYPFDVDELVSSDGGLDWITIDGEALAFSFTVAAGSAFNLFVTDAGFAGDQFELFDNGVSLGLTSDVADSYPTSVGTHFTLASESGNYSAGFFQLGEGTHLITGRLFASALDDVGDPLNATVGALRVAPVPLPAAAWLLLSGGGLMGLFSRRRKPVAA